jgi:sodium-coupled monocarboxylate transporter 8/12
MSAITLLGTPAEIYQYGSMYWFIGVSYFLVIPAAAYLYLPVFYGLELTSAYEVQQYIDDIYLVDYDIYLIDYRC